MVSIIDSESIRLSSNLGVPTLNKLKIGCTAPEFMHADYLTVDSRLSNEILKSRSRLKQEVNNEQINSFKI